MIRAVTTSIVLVCAILLIPERAWAQTYCRGSDTLATRFRDHIARYSVGSRPDEVAVRDSLRLGAASQSAVTLVSDEAVCRKANTGYQNSLTGRGTTPFSGKVYVVKSGTTYAVLDPDVHVDGSTDNWIIVILDSRYKKLSLF